MIFATSFLDPDWSFNHSLEFNSSKRQKNRIRKNMDNFNLNEYMGLADAYVGPMIDAIYCRLMDRDFALEDPEVVMLLAALINILGHDNRGDHPMEVLLAAYGERGVLDCPNMRVMRWRNGALS